MTNINETFDSLFQDINERFSTLKITEIKQQMAVLELLNIKTYEPDGFKKVAEIEADPTDGTWRLVEQRDSLFEDHNSWVYAIVVGEEIVKIGETGLPLGIRAKRGDISQPVIGTHNRFGRLRGFGKTFQSSWQRDTDVRIRSALHEEACQAVGKVSLWAKRCDLIGINSKLYGEKFTTYTTYHKQIEKAYLTHIQTQTGILPRLNVGKI